MSAIRLLIVDAEDKIEGFMPFLDTIISEGLITKEKVKVIAYRHNPENGKNL